MKVYVDTGVLLANIITNDPNHETASILLSRFSGEELIISELNIIEMYSVLSRNIDLIEVEGLARDISQDELVVALVALAIEKANVKLVPLRLASRKYLLGNKSIVLTNVGALAIEKAMKLKLKTLDLLHIAIAELLEADIFLTLDRGIIKRSQEIEKGTGIKIVGKA